MPDCPSVGRASMVSSSSEAAGSSYSLSLVEEGSTMSTNIQNAVSHSSSVPYSRLAAVQQHKQAPGISESDTRRTNLFSKKKPSTNNPYDYRWKPSLDWRVRREVGPFNHSMNTLGEFLISLHDKNYSPATVKDICC